MRWREDRSCAGSVSGMPGASELVVGGPWLIFLFGGLNPWLCFLENDTLLA